MAEHPKRCCEVCDPDAPPTNAALGTPARAGARLPHHGGGRARRGQGSSSCWHVSRCRGQVRRGGTNSLYRGVGEGDQARNRLRQGGQQRHRAVLPALVRVVEETCKMAVGCGNSSPEMRVVVGWQTTPTKPVKPCFCQLCSAFWREFVL